MISAVRRVSPVAWVGVAAVGALLLYWPMTSDGTELRQHSQVLVTVAAVLGVNVATGFGGMISLGHGVFVGVGAFATGYYVDDLSLPWVLAIVFGVMTAGLAGALVGLPALRIKGIHLALVTLGLAIVFQPLAKRFPKVTGGVSGRAPNGNPAKGGNRVVRTRSNSTVPIDRFQILCRNEDTFVGSRELTTLRDI